MELLGTREIMHRRIYMTDYFFSVAGTIIINKNNNLPPPNKKQKYSAGCILNVFSVLGYFGNASVFTLC